MYKYLLLISILLASCTNEFDFDCEEISPEINEFTFSFGSLDVSSISDSRLDVQVVEGSNVVFDYIHFDEDCLTTIDDESGSKIQFEIDSSLNSLTLEDEELLSINCIYFRTGAWGNVSFMLTEGKLDAQKISDTEWQVSFNSEVNRFNIDEFSIDKVFTLQ